MSDLVTEPSPGVFQIQLPLPMSPRIINVYLIRRGGEGILIDTGLDTEDSATALEQGLAAIGCKLTAITHVICTHHHPDHYGASERIKRLSGAQVILHKKELDYLLRALLRFSSSDYRAFFRTHAISLNDNDIYFPAALRSLRAAFHPVVPDLFIKEEEETLRFGDLTLKTILTPGHTPGHMCVYLPASQLLFTGDHLLPKITPHVGIYPGSEANPLGDYLAALKKLEPLPVTLALPAHGPCFQHHQTRIEQIIAHHKDRQTTILNFLAQESLPAYDLASKVFTQPLPPVHRELATFETIAHLELLLRENKVAKEVRAGVIYYRVNGLRTCSE